MSDVVAQMHSDLFDVFAEPVTLAGVETRAVVTQDAEVYVGDILDHRDTAEFLRSDGTSPSKGAALVFAGRTYRLDAPLPNRAHRYTSLWMLR